MCSRGQESISRMPSVHHSAFLSLRHQFGERQAPQCYLCFRSDKEVPLQGSSCHPHVLRIANTTRTHYVSKVGQGSQLILCSVKLKSRSKVPVASCLPQHQDGAMGQWSESGSMGQGIEEQALAGQEAPGPKEWAISHRWLSWSTPRRGSALYSHKDSAHTLTSVDRAVTVICTSEVGSPRSG
jgi:hypothetical protein